MLRVRAPLPGGSDVTVVDEGSAELTPVLGLAGKIFIIT